MSKRMSTSFRPAAVASGVVAILALSACGSAPPSTAPDASGRTKVVFALQPTSNTACVQVSQEQGVFEKHGIDLQFGTPAPTASGQVAQMLNGEVTVGAGAYTAVISAVDSGLPVVITNGIDQDFDRNGQTPLALIVRPDAGITSFGQLAGKTIAVNSMQGSWEVLVRESVAKSGGDPNALQLTAVPFPDQGPALKSGRVDAVFALQPFAQQLIDEGFPSIGDPLAVSFDKPDAVTSVAFMSRQFTEENPDATERFVAAVQEGNEWCNAHPEEMKQVIARITQIPQDVVDNTPLPQYSARIDSAETEVWSRLLVRYGIIDEAPSAQAVQWSGAPVE
jgi:NitT/TauT family transport system substrate-binding protein